MYSALALRSKLCITWGLVSRANLHNAAAYRQHETCQTRPRNQQRNEHKITPVFRSEGAVGGCVGVKESNWWGCAAQILKPVPCVTPESVIFHILFRPDRKLDIPFGTSKISILQLTRNGFHLHKHCRRATNLPVLMPSQGKQDTLFQTKVLAPRAFSLAGG